MATNTSGRVLPLPSQSFSIRLLATLASVAALYFASSLFIPIGLSLLLSLTLFPIIRAGERLTSAAGDLRDNRHAAGDRDHRSDSHRAERAGQAVVAGRAARSAVNSRKS